MVEALERQGRALVAAAIPLEALNIDNKNGAKWMAPELRSAIVDAALAIRVATDARAALDAIRVHR
jgi:hypothetical protein